MPISSVVAIRKRAPNSMKTKEEQYKANPEFKDVHRLWLWTAELAFTLIAPIYLWGWLIGILVHSGLSSLIHICLLLKAILKKLSKED